MISSYGILHSKKSIEQYFNAKFYQVGFEPVFKADGFSHPLLPIILDISPNIISGGSWGLMPSWAKSTSYQNSSLNISVHTLSNQKLNKEFIQNRCLIIASHFFITEWLDEKGINKDIYKIGLEDSEIFCLAGLYSIWKDKCSNSNSLTFTLLTKSTKVFNEKVSFTNKISPLILRSQDEYLWLSGYDLNFFTNSFDINLTGDIIG